MEFRMIAVDLDGTALLAGGRRLSERVGRAFDRAYERGIEIVPTTGRPYGILPPSICRGARWQHLCVLCNGGEIRDLRNGRILDQRYMKGTDLIRFAEMAERLQIPAEAITAEKFYLTRESLDRVKSCGRPHLAHHIRYALGERGAVVDDFLEFLKGTDEIFVKAVCPLVEPEMHARVEEEMASLPLAFFWGNETGLEVTHREATKARGLARVCRMLDIPMEQVLAIGDSGNDIPMLRQCGMGIAMGSAPDNVKAAASAVTASNEEDGVALAIEKYVLKEEEQ